MFALSIVGAAKQRDLPAPFPLLTSALVIQCLLDTYIGVCLYLTYLRATSIKCWLFHATETTLKQRHLS